MTFDELDRSLPNGFHDAWIKRVDVDYSARKVSLLVKLLVGMADDPPQEKDRLREGLVVFDGLEFIVLEPPIPGGTPMKEAEPWVVTYLGAPLPAETKSLPVPSDCFLAAFFLSQWNSNIYVAARSVTHRWVGE